MRKIDFPLPCGFAFDAAEHRYTLDGRGLRGVTSAIRAAGHCGDAVSFYTEAARERGTAVHRMLQLEQDGELDETTVDERIAGYLSAWRAWKNAVRYLPLLTEQAIYCAEPEYAGTLDSAGILNGALVVVDIKTGSYPAWARLQLTAYMHAMQAARLPIVRGLGLCLKGDGTFKVHPYEYSAHNRAEWTETLRSLKQ